MKKSMPLILALIALPAFGQTVYKCPSATPGAPPVIQQMPCSPQGGGETLKVNPIKTAGDGGIRASERDTDKELSTFNRSADQGHADKQARIVAEEKRQEQLDVERDKAEAQWETARAIWATGRR